LKNRVLADTTIWVEFFRGKSEIGNTVETLLIENAVWTCGVVMFEVFQGIKAEGEKSKILDILSILPYVEMTRSLWQKSADLSLLLKKKGLTLPNSDIFIAALALEHDLSIYSLDKHFSQIPGTTLYGA
jgi:tRNA(fMet)-specific endonuclease VapC